MIRVSLGHWRHTVITQRGNDQMPPHLCSMSLRPHHLGLLISGTRGLISATRGLISATRGLISGTRGLISGTRGLISAARGIISASPCTYKCEPVYL